MELVGEAALQQLCGSHGGRMSRGRCEGGVGGGQLSSPFSGEPQNVGAAIYVTSVLLFYVCLLFLLLRGSKPSPHTCPHVSHTSSPEDPPNPSNTSDLHVTLATHQHLACAVEV
ncbi:uncharacterized protein LOC125178297 [Hyalella azteca]|uniref:Uncharacterized protein LOC125178297 n=1 Tax=Hyalella azteca TaxID=294128 RepID=A0A979FKX5_HYAAZ|nr:uncharacterized protein LOC125178297 [Hyalella azteca]